MRVFWFTCSNRNILESAFGRLFWAAIFLYDYLSLDYYLSLHPIVLASFSVFKNNTIIFKVIINVGFEPMFVRFVHLEQKNITVQFSNVNSCLVFIFIEL